MWAPLKSALSFHELLLYLDASSRLNAFRATLELALGICQASPAHCESYPLKMQLLLQVLSSKGAASAQRAKALLAHYKPGAASASAAATAASNAAGMLIAFFLCPLPSNHVTVACQLTRVLEFTFCWCV